MPKVILKHTYAKEDAKVKALNVGEVAVITDIDNPGIAFKNADKEVVFIGVNGGCSCNPSEGSESSGSSTNLSLYQKKILAQAVNEQTTVEGSLNDLDSRINQLENSKPQYTAEELQAMGQFGTMAYKNEVGANDLALCVRQQLAAAESSVQPKDLNGYQKQKLSATVAGYTADTVEGMLSELAGNISALENKNDCQCTAATWASDASYFKFGNEVDEIQLLANNIN